jgi:hypothetical protein
MTVNASHLQTLRCHAAAMMKRTSIIILTPALSEVSEASSAGIHVIKNLFPARDKQAIVLSLASLLNLV